MALESTVELAKEVSTELLVAVTTTPKIDVLTGSLVVASVDICEIVS